MHPTPPQSPQGDPAPLKSPAAAYPSPPASPQEDDKARVASIHAQLEIPPYRPKTQQQSGASHQANLAPPTATRPQPRPVSVQGVIPHSNTMSHVPSASNSFRGLYPATPDVAPAAVTRHVATAAPATTGGRQHRATHQIVPATAPHPNMSTHDQAALTYYAQQQQQLAHYSATKPRIFFGNYQLMQTLGEGEFGKVKLGIHPERGEEVAIKLIKRGSVTDAARATKVAREIDVLRIVKHPHIVQLVEVVETEKYIGIVLEYASGGELFDHILAHRYLKDRDASKLFAQLISAVHYLHEKKVVHRDLKLENLLLDRDRNIIVTDFGFANRFEAKGEDLMATSCGSPCYAAPELVVQDGRYVGTAVDVWSCGVILYAMLAGYLPYDDDPNNPEGDNINLLYKYIISTKLTFPEWIGPEPRDLLLRMLVPDPQKRCSLQDVMRHSWLRKYVPLFEQSVEDLEERALHNTAIKREAIAYARQQVMAQQQQQAAQARRHQTRHQTANIIPTSASMSADFFSSVQGHTSSSYQPPGLDATMESRHAVAAASRPPPSGSSRRAQAQSAMVVPTYANASPITPVSAMSDSVYDPFASSTLGVSVPMAVSASAPAHAPPGMENGDVIMSEGERRGEPRSKRETDEDATVTREESVQRTPKTASPMTDEARKRKNQAHRYTVQVEYVPLPEVSQAKAEAPVASPEVVMTEAISPIEELTEPSTTRSPTPPPELPAAPQTPTQPASKPASPAGTPTGSRKSTPRPRHSSIPFPTPQSNEAPPPVPYIPQSHSNQNVKSHLEEEASASRTTLTMTPTQKQTSRTAKAHRKGPSNDKTFFSRFLGSSTTSVNKHDQAAEDKEIRRGRRTSTVAANSTRPGTAQSKTSSIGDTQSILDSPGKQKKARRKALSMVVEPFQKSGIARNRRPTTATQNSATSIPTFSSPPKIDEKPPVRATKISNASNPSTIVRSKSTRQSSTVTSNTPTFASSTTRAFADLPPQLAAPSKAKRVADWFRFRSRDNSLAESTASKIRPPQIVTDFDRPPAASTRSKRVSVIEPTVVITEDREPESQPTSRSASGAQSENSMMSNSTAATTIATSESLGVALDGAVMSKSTPLPRIQTTSRIPHPVIMEPEFNDAKLRFHNGAVEQKAITSRSPPLVMDEIRHALYHLGLDVTRESDFKLRVTRKSRKKFGNLTGLGFGDISNARASQLQTPAATPVLGPGGDRRNSLMAVSPSLTGSGFRSIFTRKGSTNTSQLSPIGPQSVGMHPTMTSASTNSISDLGHDSIMTSSPSTPSVSHTGQPMPFYGDSQQDTGGEVRLTVELTKMKGLEKLYIVDIRRIKGHLWDYKHAYNAILDKLDLASK